MKKNSIITKISLFFLLFVVVLLIFYLSVISILYAKDGMEFGKKIFDNRHLITEGIRSGNFDTLKELNIKTIDVEEVKNIFTLPFLSPPPPPLHKKHQFLPSHPPMPDSLDSFEIQEIKNGIFKRIVIVGSKYGRVALEDCSESEFYIYISIAYLSVFIPATLLFWAILISLRPLKRLEQDIINFGKGILPTNKPNGKNDEISRIRAIFYDTSLKINSLIESRDLFLKNSAHELKTPIAKGLVVAHMIKDEKHKEWLLSIFSGMNKIIENLTAAEELYVKEFSPKIEKIDGYALLQEVRERVFLPQGEIEIDGNSGAFIEGDRELLSIALINLIDNALKFADDKKAICAPKKDMITVKNRGSKLEDELDRYCEPFYKETSIRNESGMGLGLYLVKKVLHIQNLKLNYIHKDGYNIFYITNMPTQPN